MIDADVTFPISGVKRLCFLKNIIDVPHVEVGDYTYYDDPDDVQNFMDNILYHFDFIGDKLIVGKFCQIATGVRFIMNGGNHALDGFSAFPFRAFGGEWSDVPLHPTCKGDTTVGHDVWLGNGVTMMPGVSIGHGAIIASNAVVTKDVVPYAVMGGNPARLIRMRFSDETIERLLDLAWWDWSIEKITKHANLIAQGDPSVFDHMDA